MKIKPTPTITLISLLLLATNNLSADEKTVTKTLNVNLGDGDSTITVPPEVTPDEDKQIDLPLTDNGTPALPPSIPVGNNVPNQSASTIGFSTTGTSQCNLNVSSPSLNDQGGFVFRGANDPVGFQEITYKLKANLFTKAGNNNETETTVDIANNDDFAVDSAAASTTGCEIRLDNLGMSDFEPAIIPAAYSGIKTATLVFTMSAQ
ncbi:MAG: hypothetical protein R3F02_21975 [Thiolinea sp.]